MTIDAIAGGGRLILGLGLSGPQIVEGWYGQPWAHPERPAARLPRRSCARCSRCGTGDPRRAGAVVAVPRAGRPAREAAPVDPAPGVADPRSGSPTVGPRNTELCAEIVRRLAADGVRSRRRTESYQRAARPRHRRPNRRPRRRRASRSSAASACASPTTCRAGSTPDAPLPRDVRRRHGERVAQLPPRGHGPARLPRGRRRGSRSCSSPAAGTRRSPRCPTSTSSRTRSSARPAGSGSSRERGDTIPSGVTGLLVDAKRSEELDLVADLAGLADADSGRRHAVVAGNVITFLLTPPARRRSREGSAN